jgi:hypothetical protein
MMTSEHDKADGELVDVVHPDLLRQAFSAAIQALWSKLGDSPVTEHAVREILEAETRTRYALTRRRVLH